MVSVQSVSNYFARKLASKVPNEYPTVEDQVQVYEYGLMAILGSLVKGFLLVAISSLFGVLLLSLVTTITFSSLRVLAGGYHLSTFKSCMIMSLTQFIGSALIIIHTYQYWSIQNIYSLLFFCILMTLYIIFRYIPRDTPNKPITDILEINKFKKWSFYYLLSWTIMMTIFLLLGWKLIVIASCFGLLLELFSISILGQIVYSIINNI